MDEPSRMEEDHLLTVTETAERLRVGRTTVYRLMSEGDLQTVRVGKGRRVRASDLSAYIKGLR